jgi:hypothetical protein
MEEVQRFDQAQPLGVGRDARYSVVERGAGVRGLGPTQSVTLSL